MATIAERMKEALALRGMKQSELVALTGIGKSSISTYLTGEYEPKQKNIYKISQALDVSEAWLMGFDVPMRKNSFSFNSLPENIIPLPQTKNIPLLGDIACGEPILAEENISDYIKADTSVNADFALRCKGDSMINARIFDGDIVYIRQQSDVDDGEIAAVLIGDEATLKKVYKTENKLVLRPCNPMYDDLVYSNDALDSVRILGKAIMFTSLVRHGK